MGQLRVISPLILAALLSFAAQEPPKPKPTPPPRISRLLTAVDPVPIDGLADPLDSRDYERLLIIFAVPRSARTQADEAFDAYIAEWRRLRDEVAPQLEASQPLWERPGLPEERREAGHRAAARLLRIETTLFEQLAAAAGSTPTAIEESQHHRRTAARAALKAELGSPWLRGQNDDVAALLDQVRLEPAVRVKALAALASFENAYERTLREVSTSRDAVEPQLRQKLEAAKSEAGSARPEIPYDIRARIEAEVKRPVWERTRTLSKLNRQALADLAPIIPYPEFLRLRAIFFTANYFEHPNPWMEEDPFAGYRRQMVRKPPADPGAAKARIDEIDAGYRAALAGKLSELIELIDDARLNGEPLGSPALASIYQSVNTLCGEIFELGQTASSQMAETLAMPDRISVRDWRGGTMPARPQIPLGNRHEEPPRLKDPQARSPVTIPFSSFMAESLRRERVEEIAKLAGDADPEVVHQLVEACVEAESAAGGLLEKGRNPKGPAANATPAERAAAYDEQEIVQWEARLAHEQALAAAENSLFEGLAAIADPSARPRIEHLQRERARERLRALAHRGMGLWGESLAWSNFYAVDYLAAIDRAGLSPTSMQALAPLLAEYERDITSVFERRAAQLRTATEPCFSARVEYAHRKGTQAPWVVPGSSDKWLDDEPALASAERAWDRALKLAEETNTAWLPRLLAANLAPDEHLRLATALAVNTWPSIFLNSGIARYTADRAMALDDLPRQTQDAIAASLRAVGGDLETLDRADLKDLLEPLTRTPQGHPEIESFLRRGRLLDRHAWDRRELAASVLRTIERLLTAEQWARIRTPTISSVANWDLRLGSDPWE